MTTMNDHYSQLYVFSKYMLIKRASMPWLVFHSMTSKETIIISKMYFPMINLICSSLVIFNGIYFSYKARTLAKIL
jgi:hypothetical protein